MITNWQLCGSASPYMDIFHMCAVCNLHHLTAPRHLQICDCWNTTFHHISFAGRQQTHWEMGLSLIKWKGQTNRLAQSHDICCWSSVVHSNAISWLKPCNWVSHDEQYYNWLLWLRCQLFFTAANYDMSWLLTVKVENFPGPEESCECTMMHNISPVPEIDVLASSVLAGERKWPVAVATGNTVIQRFPRRPFSVYTAAESSQVSSHVCRWHLTFSSVWSVWTILIWSKDASWKSFH